MKKTEHVIFKKSYKKNKKESGSQISLLFFLIGLLSLFVVFEKFSVLMSFLKPFSVEQVLAIETVQDVNVLLSPTASPSFMPVFTLEALSATPTPTPQDLLRIEPQGDFCFDVPIFMYHHVQPMAIATSQGHGQLTVDSEVFDQHMAYLLSIGYHMISSEDVVNALLAHQQLPAKSIVITVDDGYDDNYDYAYQTAQKYKIKMDFMIPTGLINTPGYMTWDQVRELSQNPLVKLYNHTHSHAALGGADRDTIIAEVMEAQKQLEANVGVKNPIFVYPYGSLSPFTIEVLKEQGFIAGISTIQGTRQCKSTIMELQRTRIGNAPLSFYGY